MPIGIVNSTLLTVSNRARPFEPAHACGRHDLAPCFRFGIAADDGERPIGSYWCLHAVYGLAWADLAYVTDPGVATVLLCGAAVIVLLLSIVRLRPRRTTMPQPDDGAVGTGIKRINVATGLAVVAVVLVLHAIGERHYLIPAVLAVMAVHFLSLWRLLGRASLAAMGAALMAAAILAVVGRNTAMAPMLASVVFLLNAVRLLFGRAPAHDNGNG